MNIANPSDTTHTLQIVPRFYPSGAVAMELKNEETKQVTNYTITPVISGGYMYAGFDQVFKDNATYQVKIEADGEIVYRGKLFVTNQSLDTQHYSISKDIFRL